MKLTEIDDVELMRLVETDWAIKRLRTRLLAYRLSLRDAAQDRRRRRETALREAKRDKAAKEQAMKIDVHLPSWTPVLEDIFASEQAQRFLEKPFSNEDDEEDDAEEDDDDDGFLSLSDDQLRQFIEGVPAGEGKLNYIHYTKPEQPYVLQAMAVFLMEKGFLTTVDLVEPHKGGIPAEIKEELRGFGLMRNFVPQDRNFRGDYVARNDTNEGTIAALVSFHTDAEEMAYVARYIEAVFARRSTDTPSSFENRVRYNQQTSRIELTGWAYYEIGQPFVVVLEDPRKAETAFHYSYVPVVLVGSGIEDPVPVRGSKPSKKDISIRLKGLASKFVWVKMGSSYAFNGDRPGLMSTYQEEETFSPAAEKMLDDSNSLFFSISYQKELALLKGNEL